MKEMLSQYTIIFDWKRTLYDPDSKTLITGTLEVLKLLTGVTQYGVIPNLFRDLIENRC